ncbi:MAG: hypothetical protein IJW40_02815 [Clostridia bacterium]|nr:hypothetical protein [Clostridia bacterium]
MERNEMPVGFVMALAMNPDAMQKFGGAQRRTKATDHRRNARDKKQR